MFEGMCPHPRRLDVRGEIEFVHAVGRGTELLRHMAPDYWDYVLSHLSRVEESRMSYVTADQNPAVFYTTWYTVGCSATWCAAVLVHESQHVELYRRHLRHHGLPVPNEVWTGMGAEMLCFGRQLDAARLVGAPSHEVMHIQRQNGAHAMEATRWW